MQMALRVFPSLLFGKDHAYGNPLTGSGTEESISNLERENLVDFYKTWFTPNNSTLVIVGAITMDEIKPKLETLFKKWRPDDVPEKNISTVNHKDESVVYLLDRPGSLQSIIFAGHVAPPSGNPNEVAIEAMNNILGGDFTSRVNMNIREDKGWAYGAFTFFVDARGQRPFIAYAPVQSDKTKESMAEILKELRNIKGDIPPTIEELEKTKNNQILSLPGSWETNGEVGGSINTIVRFGLPDDYFDTYADEIRNLTLNDVSAMAEDVLHTEQLVWVIVGDREKIEQGIRDMGFDEIQFIDADGNPID
jgi:zinc protease